MNKRTFFKLLDNYLDGTATEAEQQLVEEYYRRLTAKGHTLLKPEEEQAVQEMMLQNIRRRIGQSVPEISLPERKVKFPFWLGAVAASLFLAVTVVLYFQLYQNPVKDTSFAKRGSAGNIVPGGNQAVLTLADGRKIVLNNAKNGVLAKQGNTAVNKTKDGQLTYSSGGSGSAVRSNSKFIYNTISTPYGGQYQVILPDGTKVWLNSASTLQFPAAFTGGQRKVQLTGEAYFEVAKNKNMPFIVTADDVQVEVLGTHFNIMSYADESSMNTTLLEGSVKIIKGGESRMIIPGQQARVMDNAIKVADADVKEVMSWKNGYFMFKNEDIQSIMRKISRWYNVEVEYRGDVSGKIFGGLISRSRNISEVLDMLELTGSIHFKIEGRRVIVMP